MFYIRRIKLEEFEQELKEKLLSFGNCSFIYHLSNIVPFIGIDYLRTTDSIIAKNYVTNYVKEKYKNWIVVDNVELSNAENVAIFTHETTGKLELKPRKMTESEVEFLIRMKISEMMEFAATVSDDPVQFVKGCFNTDLPKKLVKDKTDIEIMAEQMDSVIDDYYYTLNAFSKCGMNISKGFNKVHNANMNKKFSDGIFHKREDGKVIKPEGWKEPNIIGVIQDQIDNGSWA